MWKRISVGQNKNLYDIIFDDYNDIYGFCDILADYILNRYPECIISNILKHEYDYLNSNEIYKITDSVLKQNKLIDKQVLSDMLADYISHYDRLIIDGFVTFRLSDYIKELEAVTDRTAKALIVQREYDEFIDLLKFFVDIQSPVIETIHIIRTDNKYIILDESFKEITNEYIDDFLHELRYGRIDYDDLLLSTLITMAPSEIYIHNSEQITNKELLNTLKRIFNRKIHFYTENMIKESNIVENMHLS